MQGFQFGAGLRQRREEAQMQQAQQTRQQEFQSAVAGLVDSGFERNRVAEVMAQFPELGKQLSKPLEMMDTAQKESTQQNALNVFAALEGGFTDVARGMLQQQVEAAENSGDARAAAGAKAQLQMLEINPEAAKSSAGLFLASTMGPERFSNVLDTLRERQEVVDPTTKQRDYEFYVQQETEAGRTPLSFNDWDKQARAAGATTVTVGGASEVGTIPQGFELFTDPETGARRMQPIAGGPAETDIEKAAIQKAEAVRMAVSSIDNVLDTVNEAIGVTGRGTAGFASLLDFIPESGPRELGNMVDTIQANLGFDKLQSMRDASPTGGALGQVSERELNFLQSTVANLDRKAKPETLKKNLKKILGHYKKWRGAVINARGQELMNQGMTKEAALEQLATEFPQ